MRIPNLPWRQVTLYAAMAIPLGADRWTHLRYGKISQNHVGFTPNGIEITVASSASPLLFKMSSPRTITSLSLEGSTTGFPSLEPKDYALRVGMVTEGTKKLNWFQRFFAPEWLKQLVEMAPGSGLGKVSFFVVSQGKELGERRILSEGEAMEETVAASLMQPGNFNISQTLAPPLPVSAIWLQSDGDDSRSSFSVVVKSLTLVSTDET